MIRIVLFDRTTGEPAEIIESHDASFAQLNGNREKYIAKEIGKDVNWRKIRLNLDTGDVEPYFAQESSIELLSSAILLPGNQSSVT